MYGRIKQKPLTQTNESLTCQSVRQQLQKYIDDQAKRVNVDSAKKKAVLQHMDYEGFRQMVLGANLFSVKSAELTKFSGGLLDNNTEKTFNVLVTKAKKSTEPNIQVVEKVLKQSQYTGVPCNSFSQFKKRFSQHYEEPLSQKSASLLYQLLKDQNQQRILKIFNSDFDPSFFSKIFQVLIYVLREHVLKQKDTNQFLFICKLLEIIGQIKNIGAFVLKLLSKKQKTKLKQLLDVIVQSGMLEGQADTLKPLYEKYTS